MGDKPDQGTKREGWAAQADRMASLIASVACVILGMDLVLVVVTGGLSILTPLTRPSPLAFTIREVALAAALVTRLRVLAPAPNRLSAGQLMLMLAVFPALFHLHFVGRRITGDAIDYYIYTRSMLRDGDLDFANEFDHYGLLTRADHAVPTDTGHRRSVYAVGPGLLWVPFFVAADGLSAVLKLAGLPVDTSGYGRLHLNAVALGSFGYGIAAVFLIHAFLRHHFSDRLAGGTVLLLWWASFLPWYLAEQPLTSHPASALLVAAFFLLRQNRALESSRGSMALGLTLGLAMCVRWQSGVYLLLPAVDLLVVAWQRREALGVLLQRGLLVASAVCLGASPQMLAWKAIFGMYLLPHPPLGVDYVRPTRPYLLNTLFSSRHGLLSWTPVFSLCLVGLLLLTRRHPRRFGILWAPLIIMTYVNAIAGDWWAGGSFSNRRFDTLFPIFALGLASFLQVSSRLLKRHPSTVLAGLALCGATWKMTYARAIQLGEAPAGAPLSFAARALSSAQALGHDVGFPTTWPASWIFAARYDTTPGAFDLAAGRYLFFRQNNLGGTADLGSAGDEGLILDGFSSPKQDGFTTYRSFTSEARLIVSLDLPERLRISLRTRAASGPGGDIEVLINGKLAGPIQTRPDWSESEIEAPQHLWSRGPSVITLRSPTGVHIDVLNFSRPDQ